MDFNNRQVLTDREISLIIKIASKFNLTPKTAYGIGGEYLLYDDKNYLYKINKVTEKRSDISDQFKLVSLLNKENISNTIKVLRARNGDYFYKYHKTYYYVTFYYNGIPFDFNNGDHLDCLIVSLGEFHNSSLKLNMANLGLKDKTINNSKKIMENLYSFERFSNIIINRNIISTFDEIYAKTLPYYVNLSLIALSQVKEISINSNIQNGDIDKVICINRFRESDLHIVDSGIIYNNLSRSTIGLRVYDIHRVIMKLFTQVQDGDYLSLTKDVIERYNGVYKLTKEEIKILFSLIIFPDKFYRLGKRRYISRKMWDEEKYMDELKKSMSYCQRSKKFINGFLEYIKNYEY